LSCFDQDTGLDEEDEDEDGAATPEDFGFQTSPPSITNSYKRGSSTINTTSSPSKNSNKKKVSANVIMLGLVTQLEIAADKEVKALK
jgi:hypothetical protein